MLKLSGGALPLCLSVLWSAGCLTPPAPGAGQRSAAILEGTDEAGHPEVVLLLLDATGGSAGGICTATVVGSKTLLTAAHCLAKTTATTTFAEIGKGKIFDVAAIAGHPSWDKSVSAYANDIGLVTLAQPSPVAAVPLAFSPPTTDQAVQLIGFGRSAVDDPTTAGTKRRASQKIAGVAGGHFTVKGSTHNFGPGDSGGPVLANVDGVQVVIGVHSATDTGYTTSYNVRLDAFRPWLESTAGGDLLVHGAPPVDAGAPQPDAKPPASDAEPPASDAASPMPDADAVTVDQGTTEPGVDASGAGASGDGAVRLDGGCSLAPSSLAPSSLTPSSPSRRSCLAWIVLLLGALALRRSR